MKNIILSYILVLALVGICGANQYTLYPGDTVIVAPCTSPPTCTSWTYTYGTCEGSPSIQSMSIATASPSGCTGGSPQTSQPCTATGGGGTTIPVGDSNMGARYPNAPSYSISALGVNYYYFLIDKPSTSVTVTMSTGDWSTNQDLIFSPVRQPQCSDMVGAWAMGPTFWYGPTPTSNETDTAKFSTTLVAGTPFFVTICNRSNMTGLYSLYWYSN